MSNSFSVCLVLFCFVPFFLVLLDLSGLVLFFVVVSRSFLSYPVISRYVPITLFRLVLYRVVPTSLGLFRSVSLILDLSCSFSCSSQ